MPPIEFEVERDSLPSGSRLYAKQVITYTRISSQTSNDLIDISKGVFFTPRSGTYRFSFQALPSNGQSPQGNTLVARVNEVIIESVHNYFNQAYDKAHVNFSFTVKLEKGDRVDIFLNDGALFIALGLSKVKFSGQLLY